MAIFHNLLAHPIQLEGDWGVALIEVLSPTSNKNNISTVDYTANVPQKKVSEANSGGFQVSREIGKILQLCLLVSTETWTLCWFVENIARGNPFL